MSEELNQDLSFDLSYLNQVFQGNKIMINQIIEMFIKQVPEYVKEMEECVVRADYKSLHPLAHKAKSSITMLGLSDMESIVLEIESRSKEGEYNELVGLVEQVSSECSHITTQLEKVLKE